jgi:hypothetical protein
VSVAVDEVRRLDELRRRRKSAFTLGFIGPSSPSNSLLRSLPPSIRSLRLQLPLPLLFILKKYACIPSYPLPSFADPPSSSPVPFAAGTLAPLSANAGRHLLFVPQLTLAFSYSQVMPPRVLVSSRPGTLPCSSFDFDRPSSSLNPSLLSVLTESALLSIYSCAQCHTVEAGGGTSFFLAVIPPFHPIISNAKLTCCSSPSQPTRVSRPPYHPPIASPAFDLARYAVMKLFSRRNGNGRVQGGAAVDVLRSARRGAQQQCTAYSGRHRTQYRRSTFAVVVRTFRSPFSLYTNSRTRSPRCLRSPVRLRRVVLLHRGQQEGCRSLVRFSSLFLRFSLSFASLSCPFFPFADSFTAYLTAYRDENTMFDYLENPKKCTCLALPSFL